MSDILLGINAENDDYVVEIDEARKPFSRMNNRSGASEHARTRNNVRKTSLPQPVAPSVDSDDSSHVPGPSPSDAPRARRQNRVIQGVAHRRHSNHKSKLEDDIQSVSSSSDVDKQNSSTVPEAQGRGGHKAGNDITCLESGNEVRPRQQDRPVGWGGRLAPERKRRADQTMQSTTPKRRSSRRTSSSIKDEGLRQVKADRQKREAIQGNNSTNGRNQLHYSRERPPTESISIEEWECNEDDFRKSDASMEPPNHLDYVHSNSDCDGDLKYVPTLENGRLRTKRRSAMASTKPPRDVPEPEEVLSVDREEIAEEVKELNVDAPYSGPTHLIFEYPRGQKGKIRVTAEERGRLAEKKYLNDSLIDFFFKYQEISLQLRAPELRLTAKFFSSFFFGRLRRTKPIDYEGVKGWTKDVDIFSKQFVFVPICDSYHWSLIIVANLHNLNDFLDKEGVDYAEHKRPRIVYLDSLDPSRGTAFGDSIRRYLVEEWLCRKKHLTADDARKKALLNRFKSAIPLLKAKVPLQTNEYDCGLYVLNSLEMFLNNEGCFMDDLLRGEDQVSDAYTHVDIQMLRAKLVLLMDQFELEWREKTCPSPDEVHNRSTEDGNAHSQDGFRHQGLDQTVRETSIQTHQEPQEAVEQYSFTPNGTSSSFALTRHSEVHTADAIMSENRLQVNESTTVYEAHGDGSVEEPGVVNKTLTPTGTVSKNPEMGANTEDSSQDRKDGLRSSPLHQAMEVGSASVSDMPEWSPEQCDQFEGKLQTDCDFVDQQVDSFVPHKEPMDVESKANEGIVIQNHKYGNGRTQDLQESDLEISADTEGFCFKTSSHPVHSRKVHSQVDVQESQGVEEEVHEARDRNRKPPRNPQDRLAVGYGGNTRNLRHCLAGSHDDRGISDNANDGIDIYKGIITGHRQLVDSQSHSPLHQNGSPNEATAEELQTVDHIGETKTYMRHKTSSASDL